MSLEKQMNEPWWIKVERDYQYIRKRFEYTIRPHSLFDPNSGYEDKEEQIKWNVFFLGYIVGRTDGRAEKLT